MKEKEENNINSEDYFIEVDEINQQGVSYKCPIKIACMRRFLSAEEHWEAIYDLLIVTQNLNKNSLNIIKDNNGFVKEVLYAPIIINDDIILFAFKNTWKFAQMKDKTKLSDNIVVRSRRAELEQFILNSIGV